MRYRNYFVFYGSVSENAKLNKNSVVFLKKKFAIIMRDGNFLLILCHNGSRWFVIDSALLTNKLHSCFFFSQKTFYDSLLSDEFSRNLKFNTMLYLGPTTVNNYKFC